MLNRGLSSIIRSECHELRRILPLLVLAFLLAAILGPALSSFAPGRLVLAATSPISPLKPVPPKFVPRNQTIQPSTGVTVSHELASPAVTQTPEKVAPPTAAPTIETELPIQAPTPPPPPPPPIVAQPVASPPPTLWIVVGLLVVGAVVGALIIFRKP